MVVCHLFLQGLLRGKGLLKHVKALSGKSPGTVLCYDTGASQGMDVEGPSAYNGDEISIQTGNDIVTSHRWRRVEIAPGTFTQHVVLPHTARTISIGDLNTQCRVGFKWIEPDRKGSPGECAMFKSLDEGHEVLSGKFEIWPLGISALTPERKDDDKIIVANLNHCATPSCSCNLPKLHNFLQAAGPTSGLPAVAGSATDRPAAVEAAIVNHAVAEADAAAALEGERGPGGPAEGVFPEAGQQGDPKTLAPPPEPHPEARPNRLRSKVTAPAGHAENPQADEDSQESLLRKLKAGQLPAIDESLLPASHLRVHDTSDEWGQWRKGKRKMRGKIM